MICIVYARRCHRLNAGAVAVNLYAAQLNSAEPQLSSTRLNSHSRYVVRRPAPRVDWSKGVHTAATVV